MSASNLPLSEEWRSVSKRWVEADAASKMLEETKTAVFSQMIMALGDIPVSRAEIKVRASDEWATHISKIVEARKAANMLKVQMEYIKIKLQEWQSDEANHRIQSKLASQFEA